VPLLPRLDDCLGRHIAWGRQCIPISLIIIGLYWHDQNEEETGKPPHKKNSLVHTAVQKKKEFGCGGPVLGQRTNAY